MHAAAVVPRVGPAPPPSELTPYQNQVYVFSTAMANQAAEAYLVGHTPSIIAYHKNQPCTQTFIQNCMNKCEPYATWQPAPPPPPPVVNPPPPSKSSKRKNAKQQQQQQQKFVAAATPCSCCTPQRYLGPPSGPYAPPPGPRLPMRPDIPLSIVSRMKLPPENLTYQQRQHREERLATINQMQQMLFPEQVNSCPPRMYQQGPPPSYWNSERSPGAAPPYLFGPPERHIAPSEPFQPGPPMGPTLESLEQEAFLRGNRDSIDQFPFPPVDELVDNLGPGPMDGLPYTSIDQLATDNMIPASSGPDMMVPAPSLPPSAPDNKTAVLLQDGHSPPQTRSLHQPTEEKPPPTGTVDENRVAGENNNVPSTSSEPINNNTPPQQMLTPTSAPPTPSPKEAKTKPNEDPPAVPQATPVSEPSEDSSTAIPEQPPSKSPQQSSNASQPEKEEKDSSSPSVPVSSSNSPSLEGLPIATTLASASSLSSSHQEGTDSNGTQLPNEGNNQQQTPPERLSEVKAEEASLEAIPLSLPTEELAKNSPSHPTTTETKENTAPLPIIAPVENEAPNFDGLESINIPDSTSGYDPHFFSPTGGAPPPSSGPLPSMDPWTNLPFKHPSFDGGGECNEDFSPTRIPSFSTLQHLSPPPSDQRGIRVSTGMVGNAADSRQLLMPNHMTPPMSPYSQVYYNSNPNARMCLQPAPAPAGPPIRTSNPFPTSYMSPTEPHPHHPVNKVLLDGGGVPPQVVGGGQYFRPTSGLYAAPDNSSLYYAQQRYSSPPCLSPALPTSIPSPLSAGSPSLDKQFCGPAATNPNYAAQFYKFQQQLYTPNPGLSELD